MYGLPVNVDLTFFQGKTLLQMCIGAHDLILNFDGRVCVTVTSSIECSTPNGDRKYEDFRNGACSVAVFINDVVEAAIGDSEGTLQLSFNGGGHLAIFDDSKQYKSYTIKTEDRLIVV